MHFLKRLVRHAFAGKAVLRRTLPPEALLRLQQVIAEGDVLHRARIRLIVETAMPLRKLRRGMSTRQRAIDLFGSWRVWDTEENNGVLLYLCLAERKLELVCDRAAVRAITDDEWQVICNTMLDAFRAGRYEPGLTEGLRAMHRELAEYFPATAEAIAAGVDAADDAPLTL